MPDEIVTIGVNEVAELERCEAIIDAGLKTFVEVGNALMIIRDSRLYRGTHERFEEYCRERFGFSDRRARQLMSASEVVANLEAETANGEHASTKTGTVVPVPTRERQARPLAKLDPPAQKEAWSEAVAESNGDPSTKTIQAVVDRKLGKSKVNGVVTDDPPDVAKARAAGRIAPEVVPEVTEPEPVPDPEPFEPPAQTDEEWLAALPLSSVLQDVPLKTFQEDALLYRAVEPHRDTFKYHVSRLLNKVRRKGQYAGILRYFLGRDHPKDWHRCPAPEDGGCGGSGQLELIGHCSRCRGKGYWIS
jgi:hypothetical protein